MGSGYAYKALELRDKLKSRTGQGTVEFAVVCFAFIGMIVALGVLWHAFEEGVFVEHALASASHHVNSVFSGVVGDVLLY